MSRRSYISMTVDVDVDVDVHDVLDKLSDDKVVQVFRERFPDRAVAVPRGSGDGDRQPEQFIESAFLAAKALPCCPEALKDLFWHIHGRAM